MEKHSTQSNTTQNISCLNTQQKLSLESWGLPGPVVTAYADKGIHQMFPWQIECLTKEGVLEGKNLVYTAPTSAGKTMVAEILIMKTVLERKKKALFILPFVSVVREKVHYFQKLYKGVGIKVDGWMGSYSPPGGTKMVNVMIATIEKANNIINRLIEENKLDRLGCVVVDELHMLGDPGRGYLLELLLTKLKYMHHRNEDIQIQVVGMSATLPNLNVLAHWLDAVLYFTTFRPIPLREHLVLNSVAYALPDTTEGVNLKTLRNLEGCNEDVMYLCLDSILNSHSVLIFCPSKNWCETLANKISAVIKKIGMSSSDSAHKLRSVLDTAALSDILLQLSQCPAGMDAALKRSVSFGVGFHHAGLTINERDIVESGFRKSILKVLVSTSTLSSGVNLPARRVILRSPRHLDILTYKQMVGRAGRMGRDTEGESYLLCDRGEETMARALVQGKIPPVQSCLGKSDVSECLKRAILEVIACGIVTSRDQAILYTRCTFFSHTCRSNDNLLACIHGCIEYLKDHQFLVSSSSNGTSKGSSGTSQSHGAHSENEDELLLPSALARATLAASVPPDISLKLLSELTKARQCFVLDSELHIIYEITPYSVSEQWGDLDWMKCLSLWEELAPSSKRVAELVGCGRVEFLHKIQVKPSYAKTPEGRKLLSIFKRFYTALALQDIVNEMSLAEVSFKYSCNKGMLQSLQQSASTFAGMVTQFCRKLGWSGFEPLVSQFCARLEYGVQAELVSLLQIDLLSSIQARALYDAGFESLADIANACVSDILLVLQKAMPFQSDTGDPGGENKKHKNTTKAPSGNNQKHCILNGEDSLSEFDVACVIIQSARRLIEQHLGVENIEWSNNRLDETDDITHNAVTPEIKLKKPKKASKENSAKIHNETTSNRVDVEKEQNKSTVNSSKENSGFKQDSVLNSNLKGTGKVENDLIERNRIEIEEVNVEIHREESKIEQNIDTKQQVNTSVQKEVIDVEQNERCPEKEQFSNKRVVRESPMTEGTDQVVDKLVDVHIHDNGIQTSDSNDSALFNTTETNVDKVNKIENKTLTSVVSKSKSRYSMDLFNESNEGNMSHVENDTREVCQQTGGKNNTKGNPDEDSAKDITHNGNINSKTVSKYKEKIQQNEGQSVHNEKTNEIELDTSNVEIKPHKRLSLDLFDSSGEDEEDIIEDKTMRDDLNRTLNTFDANLGGESILEMSMRHILSDSDSNSPNYLKSSGSKLNAYDLRRKSLRNVLKGENLSSQEKSKKRKSKRKSVEKNVVENEAELWNEFRKSLTLENNNCEPAETSVHSTYENIPGTEENYRHSSCHTQKDTPGIQEQNHDSKGHGIDFEIDRLQGRSEEISDDTTTQACKNIEQINQNNVDKSRSSCIKSDANSVNQREIIEKSDSSKLKYVDQAVNMEIEDSIFESSIVKVIEAETVNTSNKANSNDSNDMFLKPKLLPLRKNKPLLEQKEGKSYSSRFPESVENVKTSENIRPNCESSRSAMLDSSFPSVTLLEKQIETHTNGNMCKVSNNSKDNFVPYVEGAETTLESGTVKNKAGKQCPNDVQVDLVKSKESNVSNSVSKISQTHDSIAHGIDELVDNNLIGIEQQIEDSTVIDSSVSYEATSTADRTNHSSSKTKYPTKSREKDVFSKPHQQNSSTSTHKDDKTDKGQCSNNMNKTDTKDNRQNRHVRSEPTDSPQFESQFPNISAIDRAINAATHDLEKSMSKSDVGKMQKKCNVLDYETPSIRSTRSNSSLSRHDTKSTTSTSLKTNDDPTKRKFSEENINKSRQYCDSTKRTRRKADLKTVDENSPKKTKYTSQERGTLGDENIQNCQQSHNGNALKYEGINDKPSGNTDMAINGCKELTDSVHVIDLTLDSDSDFIDDDLCNVSQSAYDNRKAREKTIEPDRKLLKHKGQKPDRQSNVDECIEKMDQEKPKNTPSTSGRIHSNTQHRSRKHSNSNKTMLSVKGRIELECQKELEIENSSSDEEASSPENSKYNQCLDAKQNKKNNECNGVILKERLKSSHESKTDESSKIDGIRTKEGENHPNVLDSMKGNRVEQNVKEVKKIIEETMEEKHQELTEESNLSVSSQSILDSSKLFESKVVALHRTMKTKRNPPDKTNLLSQQNNEFETSKTKNVKLDASPTTSDSIQHNTTPTQRRQSLTNNDISSLLNLSQRFKNINETLFTTSPKSPDKTAILKSQVKNGPTKQNTSKTDAIHPCGNYETPLRTNRKRKSSNIIEDTNTSCGDKRRKLNSNRAMIPTNLTGIVFNDTAVSFCNVLDKTKVKHKQDEAQSNENHKPRCLKSNDKQRDDVNEALDGDRNENRMQTRFSRHGTNKNQIIQNHDNANKLKNTQDTARNIEGARSDTERTSRNIEGSGRHTEDAGRCNAATSSGKRLSMNKTMGGECENPNDGTITQYERANKYHAHLIELFTNNTESETDKSILDQLHHIESLALSFKVVASSDGQHGKHVIGTKFIKKTNKENASDSGSSRFQYKGKELAMMYVVWNNDVAYYVNFKQAADLGFNFLSSILANTNLTLHLFNVKATSIFLSRACGLEIKARVVDPSVADWLMSPDTETKSLRNIVKSHFKQCAGLFTVFGSLLNQPAEEALALWKLRPFLESKLSQMNLWTHFTDIEMPIQQILARVELQGIGFNLDHIRTLSTRCSTSMRTLETSLHSLNGGRVFNVRSPKEWSLVKTKLNLKQNPNHAIVMCRRQWCQLDSLQSRCLNGLLFKHTTSNQPTTPVDVQGDRIHTEFSTHSQTGRIFTIRPNLQTTPKTLNIEGVTFDPRNAFTAAQDCLLVCADFKQIELRVLTHLSGDKALKDAIESEDDVFKSISSQWHRIPLDSVSEDMRNQTKSICYAIIYGMGPRSLAAKLEISLEDAADLYAGFKKKYAQIDVFCSKIVAECRKDGYVKTLCQRRRYIGDIDSSDNKLRGSAERQAVNTCIQGSAADIVKAAMIKTNSLLQDTMPNCHLVLQIHDELIYEVPKSLVSQACSLIKQGMESCIELSLQLPVAIKIGSAWGDTQPFNP
uniref:DNA polymerase theta n=2 Tax=Cacopsylla melanoneura TaxID=428564 RepID=A0A8D8T3V8_9HEMI